MEISIDTIITIISTLAGGGGGAFAMHYWQRRKAKAEAQTEEVNMAQRVQDTYQEILEDKKKEIEDNHRLISELREDRDHYKQGYMEFRDQLDKLSKEFREFRNQTEEERVAMKRDIARNGRMMECMRPFLCGREGCAIRIPVTISATGEVEKPKREIEPYNDNAKA